MNLGDARQTLLDLRATKSNGSSAFVAKVNRVVTMALRHLAQDFAAAISPDDEHIVVLPDYVSSADDVDALLQATSDRWVLRFTTSAGANLGSRPSGWLPNVQGVWDGIMHLEIQDPSGQWHRYQTREWWKAEADPPDYDAYYVSLDRRWPNTTDTNMAFRVHMPYFYMRDDVLEVLKPARCWDSNRQNVWPDASAERYVSDLAGYQGEDKGIPERFYQVGSFQFGRDMIVPYAAPTVAASGAWAGIEQEGVFDFVATFVWGRRDLEWGESPGGGAYEPQWESPPSAVSASFSHSSNPGSGIRLTAYGPDQMLNFGNNLDLRYGRSGYRVRFYVRRTAIRTAGLGTLNNVDSDSVYYLLTEIDPETTSPIVTYDWTGSVIPDRLRRLRVGASGYKSYAVWPYPDGRYELDFRVIRMPVLPVHDQDIIPVQPDALPMFIELALSYFARAESGDAGAGASHLQTYSELLEEARNRYAQPARVVNQKPFGIRGRRTIVGPFSQPS